ncbi:MAG: hypothetical protein J5938_06545 [Clostridia bacterium]|nr:hypothetical protein [Clostridia bacterium]
MDTKSKKLHALIKAALTAAILCVVSPWSLAVGPVPITLCTLFLYLSAYLLSPSVQRGQWRVIWRLG